MASEWVTLDNGYKYNRKTGETIFDGKDSKSPVYRYDPTRNRTTYNGTEFTGRYDPYAIASITGEDYDAAYKNYEAPYLDKEINKLEKNPFITSEKNVNDAFGPVSSTLNRLSFGHAYDAARKRMEGPGFFDEIKDYDFDSLEQPPQETADQFLAKNPNLSPQLQERVRTQFQVANNFQNNTGAYGPSQVQTPSQPTVSTQVEPTQPDQPDWQSLYDQLKQMMGNNQQQAAPKQRQQIGSFVQYGPGSGSRQSYQSSTPYSGK